MVLRPPPPPFAVYIWMVEHTCWHDHPEVYRGSVARKPNLKYSCHREYSRLQLRWFQHHVPVRGVLQGGQQVSSTIQMYTEKQGRGTNLDAIESSIDCQFARHISHSHESFSVRVWAEKCPSASAKTGVRRERPVKEEKEEVEEKGSKEDREKASAAKRREVPNSEYNVLHLHEDNLRLT